MGLATPTHTASTAAISPSAGIGNIITALSLGGHLAQLPGRAVAVLVAVLTRYNFRKQQAWPSTRDLAARTGLSSDTVQRAIADLERAGLIVPVRVSGQVNRYLLPARVRDLAWGNPWRNAAGDRPQESDHPSAQPAATLRPEHEETPERIEENQQDERDQLAGGVVVHEIDQPEELLREELAVEVDDQEQDAQPDRLPRELLDELRRVGVRAPWRLAKHGADRLREALDMLGKAGNVKNPAGWLHACLTGGWTRTRTDADRAAEVMTQATREHVAQVEQQRAQLADPNAARRSRLAMVAAVVKLKRPDEARLIELLGRHGLGLDEFQSYVASQEAQEGGCSSSAG